MANNKQLSLGLDDDFLKSSFGNVFSLTSKYLPVVSGNPQFGVGDNSFSMPTWSLSSPVSSLSDSGSNFSGSDLGAILSGLGSIGDGLTSGSMSTNADGTLSYSSNWWEKTFHKDRYNQNLAYVNSYNNAWNLAQEQQYLAENATLNNARQLSQLGINPAASGSGVSMSASGGSAPSVGSPYVGSSRGLEVLGLILNHAIQKEQLSIDKYNAETSRISADSNAALSGSNKAQIDYALQFIKDHGYNIPNGYSSTRESTNVGRVLQFLTTAGLAYLSFRNNSSNGSKNNRNSSNGSSGNNASSSLQSDSVKVPEDSLLRKPNTESSVIDIPDLSTSTGFFDFLEYLLSSDKKAKGSDVPISRQVGNALNDMNEQEITLALRLLMGLVSGGSTVPVF